MPVSADDLVVDPFVVEQADLVADDPVFVVVEPDRLGVASDDAGLAAVRRVQRVAQVLEDQHTVFCVLDAGDRLAGDGGDLGLAFVVGDGEPGVCFDAGQALLGLVQQGPSGFDRDVPGATSASRWGWSGTRRRGLSAGTRRGG